MRTHIYLRPKLKVISVLLPSVDFESFAMCTIEKLTSIDANGARMHSHNYRAILEYLLMRAGDASSSDTLRHRPVASVQVTNTMNIFDYVCAALRDDDDVRQRVGC
jgi:lipase chaperone LimK